jgi:SAM-dependent methyltransferase
MKKKIIAIEQKIIKLDIGCGKNKKEGFLGIDQYQMEGVDIVLNVVGKNKQGKFIPWTFDDNSIDEIFTSHFVEHLDCDIHNPERVHFFNEAFRILKPGSKMTVITPHWASNRAYGDFTHANKPVSEMFYYYLKKEWRDTQAPHTDKKWNPKGYSCNFDATWGYSYPPELNARSQEYVQFALNNYKEAILDLHATLVKPVTPEPD